MIVIAKIIFNVDFALMVVIIILILPFIGFLAADINLGDTIHLRFIIYGFDWCFHFGFQSFFTSLGFCFTALVLQSHLGHPVVFRKDALLRQIFCCILIKDFFGPCTNRADWQIKVLLAQIGNSICFLFTGSISLFQSFSNSSKLILDRLWCFHNALLRQIILCREVINSHCPCIDTGERKIAIVRLKFT